MASPNESVFDLRLNLSESLKQKVRPHINIRNFLALFALLFFLIAWNRGISLIYVLSSLMLSVLLVSYVAPYLSLRGVCVSREKYLVASVGEILQVPMEITNARGRWCRMLEVIDRVPCADEEDRYPSIYIPKLWHSICADYQVQMNWRGLHTLGPMDIRSSYPLGVNRVSRTVADSQARVLVKPTPFCIRRIAFTRAAAQYTRGSYLSPRRGGYEEFSGLREFRHGDSPRHIHWAKSSQGRAFQVKEYENHESNVVSIVLNRSPASNVGEGRYSTFEFQVSIAVSIARYCTDNGIPLALYSGATSVEVPGCGESHYQGIVESLALVQTAEIGEEKTPYHEQVQSLVRERPQGCWVVFVNDDREELHSLSFHRSVSQLLTIEFDSRSFRFPLSTHSTPPRASIADYRIARNDDLERIFSR